MSEETLTVRCACGWEITGSAAEVVPTVIEHGERIHNMTATPEQVLASASAASAGEEPAAEGPG